MRRHRRNQLVAKFSSDRRADLGDLFDGGESIQARHQRISQGGRDRHASGRTSVVVMIADCFEFTGFQNRFSQLFHIQRHAVGLVQDLVEQPGGQFSALGELVHNRTALSARELGQVQRRNMAVAAPFRLKLRPVREHDQQGNGSDPIDQQIKRFKTG